MDYYMDLLQKGTAIYAGATALRAIGLWVARIFVESREHQVAKLDKARREAEDDAAAALEDTGQSEATATTTFRLATNRACSRWAEIHHIENPPPWVNPGMISAMVIWGVFIIAAQLLPDHHPATMIVGALALLALLVVPGHTLGHWAWRRRSAPHRHARDLIAHRQWPQDHPAVRHYARKLAAPPITTPKTVKHNGCTYQLTSAKVATWRAWFWHIRGLWNTDHHLRAIALAIVLALPALLVLGLLLIPGVPIGYPILICLVTVVGWAVEVVRRNRPNITHYTLSRRSGEPIATAYAVAGAKHWKIEGLAVERSGLGHGFALIEALLTLPHGPAETAQNSGVQIRANASTAALAKIYESRLPVQHVDGRPRAVSYAPDKTAA